MHIFYADNYSARGFAVFLGSISWNNPCFASHVHVVSTIWCAVHMLRLPHEALDVAVGLFWKRQ